MNRADHNPNTAPPPLEIGSVQVRNPVFLAPMSGISDLPFRALAHDLGAGLVTTEMIASEQFVRAREDVLLRSKAPGQCPQPCRPLPRHRAGTRPRQRGHVHPGAGRSPPQGAGTVPAPAQTAPATQFEEVTNG